MNILFEIADKDLIFIGLAFVGLIIFGIVIFFVVTKNKEEHVEEDYFPEIEPKTEQQQAAKDELERVFKQMSDDLEKEPERTSIDEFEREQEENAIISYQELIKQAEAKGMKVRTFEEEEPALEKPTIKEEKQPAEKPIEEPKKFKNSAIISPIFGIQGSSKAPAHAYKESASEEQEFLSSLKEFRKNL